jgi:uncharacterized repeat protein (TIGR03847 family)
VLEQTTGEERASQVPTSPPSDPFPEQPQVDFKIGRLAIGYDQESGLVSIFAYAPEQDRDVEPTFTCQVGRRQSRAFAEQAENVVSAGRPICLLCGSPIDPGGHKCLRRNGHSVRHISPA